VMVCSVLELPRRENGRDVLVETSDMRFSGKEGAE
jgi:hypothetical protein